MNDNFWCCGDSLEAQNQGNEPYSKRIYETIGISAACLLFDGMGGESCGEMAAFLAAEACGEQFLKLQKMEYGMIRKNS